MIKKILIHTPLVIILLFVSFYVGLMIHFPVETLQRRLQYEVQNNSRETLFINIDDTKLKGLGISFSNVQLLQKDTKKEEASEVLFSPNVSLSTPFFSLLSLDPNIHVRTELFGGELNTDIKMDKKNRITINPNLNNLNAALLPLYGDAWELSFLGNISLTGKLKFPFGKFSKAKGSLRLTGNNLQLEEGRVLIKTLPSMNFTETKIALKFEKGKATIEEGLLSSDALNMELGGYIKLNNAPLKSKLYLTLKIETGEELNTLIGAFGKPYQDDNGVYNLKLLGNLSSPRIQTRNKKTASPKRPRKIDEEMNIEPEDFDQPEETVPKNQPAQIDDDEKEKRRQERIERARKRREERLKKRKTEAHGFDKVLPTPRILPQIDIDDENSTEEDESEDAEPENNVNDEAENDEAENDEAENDEAENDEPSDE